MRIGVFDLEIKTDPAEVIGGWEGVRRGEAGVSCVALYDSAIERTLLYNEYDLEECVKHLNDMDMLCSFNGIEFDTPVLQAVTGMDILPEQYDVLHEVWGALPQKTKGYKLADICGRLQLGAKTNDGASATKLYRDGAFEVLYAYCRNDVVLTRDLVKWIDRYGYILTPDGEQLELPRLGAPL